MGFDGLAGKATVDVDASKRPDTPPPWLFTFYANDLRSFEPRESGVRIGGLGLRNVGLR